MEQVFDLVNSQNDNGNGKNNNNDDNAPPPTFKPTIDSTPINDAKNIEEAQREAKKQINGLLSTSKVKISELDKKLWNNFESWEKYLLTLNDRKKIAEFVEKMKQAIEARYKINFQQFQSSQNNSQKPNRLPLFLTFGLIFLVAIGAVSLLVWRQKRLKIKKRRKKLKTS